MQGVAIHIPRPVEEEGGPLHLIHPNRPPIPAVVGVIAVVAHHEIAALGNDVLTIAPERTTQNRVVEHLVDALLQEFIPDHQRCAPIVFKNLARGDLLRRHAVDRDNPVVDIDPIPRQSNQALDKIVLGQIRVQVGGHDIRTQALLAAIIPGHFEHDHIAPLRLLKARETNIRKGNPWAIGQLVDEEVIPYQEGREHRARRNTKGLDQERANCQRDDHSHQQRADLLPDRREAASPGHAVLLVAFVVWGRILGIHGRSHSSPSLRAARKASWGISTDPTIFIRFFPAFCFSSSFRLREMSPP